VELHPLVGDDEHLRGLRGAPVTLVVYGDYECPVSARLWRVLRDMRAQQAPVCEAFRHFPLTGVHPHAFLAATAAEAAADQKNFWTSNGSTKTWPTELSTRWYARISAAGSAAVW